MRKRFLAMLLVVGFLMSVLSGCGGDSKNASGEETSAVSGAAENVQTEEGFTVTIVSDQEVSHLDRMSVGTNGITVSTLAMLWGDALISSDHSGHYEPWLAESYEMADDSMSITFHLRKGVTFSDGNELTSADVKYVFERLRDNQDMAESSVKKWRRYVDSVDVIDDYNVTLNFIKPMATFWTEISILPIYSSASLEEKGEETFWKNPVGSGPYVVDSFDNVNSITEFTRRQDYWGWEYKGITSNVDKIVFKTVSESSTRASSLRSGDVQVCENVPAEVTDTIAQEGYSVLPISKTEHMFLGVASGEGDMFEDINLRKALSMCINRSLLVDNILGSGAVVDGPATPTATGYRDLGGYEYNVDLAKELVLASGYSGEPINFICTSSKITRGNEITQAIQSMASEVGLNVEIEMLEDATYNDRRDAHEYDMYIGSYGGGNNEYFNEVTEIICADLMCTGYRNERLEELGTLCTETADENLQDEYRAEIYQIVFDEFAPNIYLYQSAGTFAWDAKLENITVYNDSIGDYRWMVYGE